MFSPKFHKALYLSAFKNINELPFIIRKINVTKFSTITNKRTSLCLIKNTNNVVGIVLSCQRRRFYKHRIPPTNIDISPCLKAGGSWFDERRCVSVLHTLPKRYFPCVPR